MDLPEISDLIVQFDPQTGQRLPVVQAEVIQKFLSIGSHRAAKIVATISSQNGILLESAVDAILLRSHIEMQRLSEEFMHGSRVREVLEDLIHAFRLKGVPPPYRVVDLGCGTGFVLRWIAAHGGLGADVQLIGADFNSTLIKAAQDYAQLEHLPVNFVVANAFELPESASIIISTGVLHHIGTSQLESFFAEHARAQTIAFAHWDFQPSPLVPFGSWLFHVSRFREPLARHDGIRSALRVHTAQTLLSAATSKPTSSTYSLGVYNPLLGNLPIKRVFHAVMGIRSDIMPEFQIASKQRFSRWHAWS